MVNDPAKMGKVEEDRRTTATEEGWEQTDHQLYRFKNWFCFVVKKDAYKTVELYKYNNDAKAYEFIGCYLTFKNVVATIEEVEARNFGEADKAGS